MSNIKKIRQEIEKLKIDYLNRSYTFVPVAMQQLLEFIDSLPEETCKDSLHIQESCKENTDSFTSLEEAAYEYSFESRPSIYGQVDVIDAFKAGAEWQKEQMKKDAVEGEIGYWNQTGLSIRLDQSLEKLGYDEDTEVKIIIVKK